MATLKNTTITDQGSITIATGTDGQRPGSPTAGMTRYSTTGTGQLEVYNGAAWVTCIEQQSARYNLAIFDQTNSFTWTVPTGITQVHVLVVAGGGGGGTRNAGPGTGGTDGGSGGGAGGFVEHFCYPVTPGGTIPVTVGAGGNGGSGGQAPGQQGQNSVFGVITALGGGWGAAGPGTQPGNPGGSGGGAGGGGGAPGSGVFTLALLELRIPMERHTLDQAVAAH